MNIGVDTVKLKSHIDLLYEERQLADQLQELCRRYYVEARTSQFGDANIYFEQQQFFEKQLRNIDQRIVVLEEAIRKIERYAVLTEEQLNAGMHRLKLTSEGMQL